MTHTELPLATAFRGSKFNTLIYSILSGRLCGNEAPHRVVLEKKITGRRNYDTTLSCDSCGTLREMACCIIVSNLNITFSILECTVFFMFICNEGKVVQSVRIFLFCILSSFWDALPIDQSTSACTGKPVVLKLE